MFTYTFFQPMYYVMDANSVKDAIKNYVKFHRNYEITQLMMSDQEKRYKAKLKYFKHDGRNKVGINVYPVPEAELIVNL
ncbi:hypothetical protein CPAV1605_1195 [seawater metagenome]|uniref:Uncharacterized protein n=1 Tax=seawater metagenome TaxID=1561972 RepID=A0A5E8CKY6_9ZZZZ